MTAEKIITVFGSSRPVEGEPDYEEARNLGRVLAQSGFAVCSGGYGGVMAGVSRGAKEAGGKTYGVTAEFFAAAKVNRWIDVEVPIGGGADHQQRLARDAAASAFLPMFMSSVASQAQRLRLGERRRAASRASLSARSSSRRAAACLPTSR